MPSAKRRLAAMMFALLAVVIGTSPVAAGPPHAKTYRVDGRFTIDTNLRSQSGWSAWAIDEWLAARTPLRGIGDAFMKAERTYDINARYLVAHAMLETHFGTSAIARSKRNLFGYNAYDRDPSGSATRFRTYDQGILEVAKFIDESYLSPSGRWWTGAPTLRGMRYYASDPKWERGIAARANEITIDSLTRRGIRFGVPIAPDLARAGTTMQVRIRYSARSGSVLPKAVTFVASWEPIAVIETRTAQAAPAAPVPAWFVATVRSSAGSRTLAVPAPPTAGRWQLHIAVRDSDGAVLPDDVPIRPLTMRVTTADEVVLGLETVGSRLGVRVTNTADDDLPATSPEALPLTDNARVPRREPEIVPTAVDVWAIPLDDGVAPYQIARVPLASSVRAGRSLLVPIPAPAEPAVVVVRLSAAAGSSAAATVPVAARVTPGKPGSSSAPRILPIEIADPGSSGPPTDPASGPSVLVAPRPAGGIEVSLTAGVRPVVGVNEPGARQTLPQASVTINAITLLGSSLPAWTRRTFPPKDIAPGESWAFGAKPAAAGLTIVVAIVRGSGQSAGAATIDVSLIRLGSSTSP